MTSSRLVFGRYDHAAFLSFTCYAVCSVIVPVVLVALAGDLGFPLDKGGMGAGGVLHSGRSAAMVAAMLFCGFVAARIGLRRSLGLGVLLMGGGLFLCAFSQWYWALFALLLIAGLGEGVIEGLATPFVQELHDQEPGRYINFAHSFWSVGVTLTMLAAGALLSAGVSWRLLLGISGALVLFPVLLLFWRENPASPYPEAPKKLSVREVAVQAYDILKRPHFWLFFAAMFLAGGGEFCLTFWCPAYIQLCFHGSAWTAGFGTAVFGIGMFVGRAGSGFMVRQHHLCNLIVFMAVAGTVFTSIVPLLNPEHFGSPAIFTTALYTLLFFCGIAAGPFWPSVQSYAVDRMPEVDTTMLFVLLSCAGIPGCGFFTWFMGFCGDRFGLSYSFYLIPLCFAGLALLIGADRLSAKRQEKARTGKP